MDAQAIAHQAPPGKDSKRCISKLRSKVDPAHPNYKGEAWLASPDGQDALRRIASYNPGRPTPGRSTTAAKIAVQTQLASIQATAEATRANTEELLQRAQGRIPERPPNRSASERKREIDQVLKSVPALREERKQMADLERQEAKDAKLAALQQRSIGSKSRRTTAPTAAQEQLRSQERMQPLANGLGEYGFKPIMSEDAEVEEGKASAISTETPDSSPASSARTAPSAAATETSTEPQHQTKEDIINHKLRILDAVDVLDSKGCFVRLAPLTMAGLCGHPTKDGKLCNGNAGDCATHRRSEVSTMGSEDHRSAIMAHGICGVPARDGGSCEKAKGRCTVHTEAWHATRELAAMRSEDRRCGVILRRGRNPCGHVRGFCPYHATESVRCKSVLEEDHEVRCWNYKKEGSDYCEAHQDRPNLHLDLKAFFSEWVGRIITEEDFTAWEKARFPNAAREFGPIYDFTGWISKQAVMCGFEIRDQICKAQSGMNGGVNVYVLSANF